ncbi:hypothetical protein EV361DRAFT_301287 [Lentinula raphanica]|uniref:Uncharacterized protein n=1 Tax=Lentinula raphanica TaxID=153919 RepID=A0AA38UDI3_9AGAR|nr:hypothetical protein F5880DRAFT_1609089 [Lentinula raphanica]KAJ3837586.1 hypothetical protein F5878DRAFT_210243 [Lentinula raphanica]KAJ3970151.1 hypothetical protein EV361DRAFT_301287 [Lentinula raphanica]
MAHIGSVFLGDSKRQRVLSSSSSSSTPPSSPLPIPSPSASASATQTTFGMALNSPAMSVPSTTVEGADEIDEVEDPKQGASTSIDTTPGTDEDKSSLPPFSYVQSLSQSLPPSIDPHTALELRLRLLEGLVVGLDGHPEEGRATGSATLVKSTETIQRTLDKYVDTNETLRKFNSRYDKYAPYLTPAFALGLLDESALSGATSSPETLHNFVREMEPEIRNADTNMQEIENLLKRGILDGEGDKLEAYIPLQPRLSALLELHEENKTRADELERRVAEIMDTHMGYIDTLSDLFIAWDDALINAENLLLRKEKEKEERERIGLP